MRSIAYFVLTASLMVAVGAAPAAASCGDDVDGVRVPCRCGDRVVSNTTLLPDDPVVSGRCAGDGLLIRARPGSPSLILELAGLSIEGSGYGTGIRILNGGSAGARIIGGGQGRYGEISGFATGVHCHADGLLAGLTRLSLESNTHDGAWIRAKDAQLTDIVALGNGRDGLRLRGRNVHASGLRSADNLGVGLRLSGEATNIAGIVEFNGQEGVVSSGPSHDLSALSSTNNHQAAGGEEGQ